MKKYKILTVTPFFPADIGGIANHVLNLTKHLTKLGNDLSIITPKKNSGIISEYYDHFTNIHHIQTFSLPGWPYPTLKSVSIPKDFGSEIKSIIRNGDFDIVHAHGHHYPFSWYAVKSATKYGIPSILTLHGMYALNPNVMGGKSLVEDLFNKYFFKNILSNSKTVIGLTEKITNYARIYGNPSLEYFTNPNGVDTELYKDKIRNKNGYRQHYNIDVNSLVILFAGRFEKVKGIIEFAKAARKIVSNVKIEVIIVGGGSLEGSVKKIIGKTNRIHLFDWQPEYKIHEFFIASDIFVIPSRFEALPLSIIEAMNAGLHIIYSPVGGMPEILEKYERKTPIKKISEEDLEDVFSKVISNFHVGDQSASLQYARTFDWVTIAEKTYKVYEECLKKNS